MECPSATINRWENHFMRIMFNDQHIFLPFFSMNKRCTRVHRLVAKVRMVHLVIRDGAIHHQKIPVHPKEFHRTLDIQDVLMKVLPQLKLIQVPWWLVVEQLMFLLFQGQINWRFLVELKQIFNKVRFILNFIFNKFLTSMFQIKKWQTLKIEVIH